MTHVIINEPGTDIDEFVMVIAGEVVFRAIRKF